MPMPKGRYPRRWKVCAGCGVAFEPHSSDQKCHDAQCRKTYATRGKAGAREFSAGTAKHDFAKYARECDDPRDRAYARECLEAIR